MSEESFPPVFCIFVREHIERLNTLLVQAEALNIKVTPWEGLHGETANVQAPYPNGYLMNKGHTSLCINHWFLWQHAWRCGHEWVIVCEDDAVLPPDFVTKTREAIRTSEIQGAHIVYLGWYDSGLMIRNRNTSRLDKIVSGFPYGTHCMLIHRRALPVLMATNRTISQHIDVQIGTNSVPELNCFLHNPSLVKQMTVEGMWECTLNQKLEDNE